MTPRPFVLLSAAMSVDGFIDDTSADRLLLSDDADLDRVDDVRAGVDAILVGATTIRRDDPSLVVRAPHRRATRAADPIKVTVTDSGDLDPTYRFFTTGDAEKLVYVPTPAIERAKQRVGQVATVVGAGNPLDLRLLLADLHERGVERLMVEGGTRMHTQFLLEDLVDEIQLAVAPFFVGDEHAPRFVGPGTFPHNVGRRMRLAETRPVGDLVLLRYLLEPGDG